MKKNEVLFQEFLQHMGKRGKELVQEGIEYTKETRRLVKEGQEKLQLATAKYQDAVSRYTVMEEDIRETLVELQRLGYSICQYEMKMFQQQFHIKDSQMQTISFVNPLVHMQEHTAPDMFHQAPMHDAKIFYKSAAFGSAMATTALGSTLAFGTASTGTAISSLSGAAAMGAAFANMGGGSLAVGGMGIIGGVSVLAGIFVVPTVLAGAFLWNKNIRENYTRILAYEEDVAVHCRSIQKSRNELKKVYRFCEDIRIELSMMRASFETMLLTVQRSQQLREAPKIRSILQNACSVISEVIMLNGVSSTGKLRGEAVELLAQYRRQFDAVQQQFGAYMAKL